MKLRVALVALLALAGIILTAAIVLLSPSASAQTPGPSAGHQLVGGLIQPRGLKIGPDGMIYVAEAGSTGDIDSPTGGPDGPSKSGFTGRISKVDPATGTRTTVADNLPSNGTPGGDAVGPADVAFIGDQLYYVQTHGGEAYGFPDNPTGVYKVNNDGTVTLVADIGAFNIANPVADITTGGQQDIETGGNPYSMTVRDGAFWVVDGNQNQIMKITPDGTITRLTDFPGHPVTTGIAYTNGGPFYVTTLGQFPFDPSAGTIRQVGYPSGNVVTVASGVSSLTDVEFGPGGQLYALNFMDQAADPFAGIPWTPFTGTLFKVDVATGTFTPLVTGFVATSALIFDGDTAYISNYGIEGLAPGEIWEVDNVSSLQALPVTPTAVPATPTTAPAATPTSATGVVAPNTGSGPDASGGFPWVVAIIGAIGALAVGAGVVRRRVE